MIVKEEQHTTTTRKPAVSLGFLALVALVVGSMIGAGIFDLPKNAAKVASPGAVTIAWVITGMGMLALARTFQFLASHAKDPEAGIYGFARDGFGRFVGTLSAWGYWVSAWLGNLAYIVIIMSTLSLVFPGFGDGTTWPAIIGGSILLWLNVGLQLRGVKAAAGVNVLVTIAKIVPILVFLVIAIIYFKPAVLAEDFWGVHMDGAPTVMTQVQGVMMLTVWVFIGIEGAAIYASRARKRKDVGKATVLGFCSVLVLLVAISLLSAGVLHHKDLAGLQTAPALAGIMEATVGKWGTILVAVGLLITVLGALLAWLMICSEIMAVPAQAGAYPKFFGKEERPGVPTTAIFMTAGAMQIFLIVVHFLGANYESLIYLAAATSLIPYLLSSAYALKLVLKSGTKLADAPPRGLTILTSLLATIYGIWLLYAAGASVVLLTTIFFALGIPMYVWARKEQGKPVFKTFEVAIAVVVILGAMISVILIANGTLTPFG